MEKTLDITRFTESTNAVLCFDHEDGEQVVCVDSCYDNSANLPACDAVNLFTRPSTPDNVEQARRLLHSLADTFHIPVRDESLEEGLDSLIANAKNVALQNSPDSIVRTVAEKDYEV